MKRLLFLILILSGCTVMTPLKRSKLISVFHLIETQKYNDAKDLVEEMVDDEESSQWSRTWYARGLLSQTAYRDGIEKNDKKKYELYPDQLYVAIESYEKALELDPGKLERQLAPNYVLLANDFQKLGEKNFQDKKFDDALKAFEQALEITRSPILSMHVDTSLVFNAAISAYEAQNWDKAIKHLNTLHDYNYSANAAHLLFEANLADGDTISAQNVLTEGIEKYDDNHDLILLLSDLLFQLNEVEQAVDLLDSAMVKYPGEHIFPYTQGLIYQKAGQYNDAIEAYKKANELAPDDLMIYVNIATCYYNIGVDIEESARTLTLNRLVQQEKSRSAEAFENAVIWLDKAYDQEPEDEVVIQKLFQLYKSLRINDKMEIIEEQIN